MWGARWALLFGFTVATILAILLVFLWPSADLPTKPVVSATLQSSSVRQIVSPYNLVSLKRISFYVFVAVIPIFVIVLSLYVFFKRPEEGQETSKTEIETLHESKPILYQVAAGLVSVFFIFFMVFMAFRRSNSKASDSRRANTKSQISINDSRREITRTESNVSDSSQHQPWYLEIPKDFDVEMKEILKMDDESNVCGIAKVLKFRGLYTPYAWSHNNVLREFIKDLLKEYNQTAVTKATAVFSWANGLGVYPNEPFVDDAKFKPVTIADFDLFLLPIHKNSHADLALVDNRSKEIVFYDSRKKMDKSLRDIICGLVKSNTNVDYKIVKASQPKQDNCTDCYIFTMAYVYFYLHGYTHDNMPFSQKDINYLRRLFAWRYFMYMLHNGLKDGSSYLSAGIAKKQLVRLLNIVIHYHDQDVAGKIVALLPVDDPAAVSYLLEHVERREACIELLKRNAKICPILERLESFI